MTLSDQDTADQLIAQAADAVRRALTAAFRVHEDLGERGIESVQTNQFGDTALRGDIEAEQAVINAVGDLKARILSEEHGAVEINMDMPGQAFTGVLDGIDGSSIYKRERGTGKYGTMFALYKGDDPLYGDYLSAGIMVHATGQLVQAVRGQGVKVINLRTGRTSHAHALRVMQKPSDAPIIYADTPPNRDTYPDLASYFKVIEDTFTGPLAAAGYPTVWDGSGATNHVALATGKAYAVVEGTRKGNLEIAVSYGLIAEAGGVMVTADNKDLGTRKVLSFGQDRHIPILLASSSVAATDLLNLAKKHAQPAGEPMV